ncbi:MAG: SRPBCC domain-containing protein [Acidimicrobiales bacterium]
MGKVVEIYIRTTPERLWESIVDCHIGARYHFGMRTESDWTPGSSMKCATRRPRSARQGRNLEVEPRRRLVQSMTALWGEDVAAEGTSRITRGIEPIGGSCQLTVARDQLREGPAPSSTEAGR